MKNMYIPNYPVNVLFKAFCLSLLALFFTGRLHAQQVSVTASAGTASATYSTLKQAIDSINSGGHQGNIVITLNSSTVDTVAISLDSNGRGGVTSYSSIIIRPADTATVEKVVSGAVSGTALFTLQGADHVTIDGRPLSTGNARLLTFQNNATTTGSNGIVFINGASFNTLRYCNVMCGSRTVTNIAVQLSTSVATNGNMNDSIDHCNISNSRSGIYCLGTVANPMDNIVLRANNVFNFALYGILFSATRNFVVDSNSIYHTIVASNTNPLAMFLQADCDGYKATVSGNRIFDLQTSGTTTIYGIYVSPTIAAPAVVPEINCVNNFVSLTQSSATASGVYGMYFLGAAPAVCRFMHNSIRIGGTHTGGTAGGVVSYGIIKTNSSASSTFVSRNNLVLNNRTAGTTGVFHTGFRITNGGMVGTLDIDQNVYWSTGTAGSGPFHTTWGNTLYGDVNGYRNAAALISPNLEVNSVFNVINYTSNTNLTLTGASVNNFIIMGCNPLVTTDIFGTPRSYPAYKGAHESTPFTNRVDAAVQEVYSLGKLPIPYANPHVVRANIRNEGIDTLFNQQVNLSIAGNNIFTDMLTIDTLAPGQATIVSFSSNTYFNTGAGTVTVSVPADSTASNNSKTFNQVVTTGSYAYADPTLAAAGGVGFTGNSGDFVAKFPYTGSNAINQVGVNFFAGGQPYQIVIYSVLNDTPGTLLWNSPSNTSVTGVNTVTVSPPVSVSGSFFVGVRQTGTTNVSFGYQAEDPIRNNTFFYKAVTVTSWADFATTNSAFRFMVEPRLQVADDIGISKLEQPCAVVLTGGAAITPQFRVNNYGNNPQFNFIVRSEITGPVNMTTADTLSTFLSGGSSMVVNASTLFNPTTPGTYNVKVWTQLAGDLEAGNDTATYTFEVASPSSVNASVNGLQLNGINQYLETNGEGSLNITGDQLTLEAWVSRNTGAGDGYIINKDSGASSQYSLYINPAGVLTFKLATLFSVDSILSSDTMALSAFTHVAATYDGLYMTLYQNGKVTASKTVFGSIMGNPQPLYIGRKASGGGMFSGTMDEIRIWDTCRTANHIRSSMHARLGNAPHANLKAYYRLDELSGTYVIDASGNCNSALTNNTPVLVATNLSLGSPVVTGNSVNFSGPQSFSGTRVAMNVYNQSGSNEIYVHQFAQNVPGISPVTNPGGVTTLYGNYWLMYRYGTGTMDSSEITFTVAGINGSAVNSDFSLFTRENGSSGAWTLARTPATSINTTTQEITMGVDSLQFNRQFAIGANNNPLPVALISFTGVASRADAVLRWATSSEQNNSGFAIERSEDGKRFTQVDFVRGAGNSNRVVNYSYTDKGIFNTYRTVYYRLRQMDRNGDYTYTRTVLIQSGKGEKAEVAVYPNPVQKDLTIELESADASTAQVVITDITGKEIYSVEMNVSEGFNKLTLNTLNILKTGVYMVRITSKGVVLYTDKLVKAE